MDKAKVLKICKQATLLAKDIEPILARNELMLEKEAAIRARAQEVSDILVRYNVVDIEKRAFVERELHDPEYAYDLIVKLAQQIEPQSLGNQAEELGKTAGGSPEDRFANWLLTS